MSSLSSWDFLREGKLVRTKASNPARRSRGNHYLRTRHVTNSEQSQKIHNAAAALDSHRQMQRIFDSARLSRPSACSDFVTTHQCSNFCTNRWSQAVPRLV